MAADLKAALAEVPVVPSLEALRKERRDRGMLSMQALMREVLRSRLDIPIIPVQLVGDLGQICLSSDEMEQACARRHDHCLAYRRTLQWAIAEVGIRAPTTLLPHAVAACPPAGPVAACPPADPVAACPPAGPVAACPPAGPPAGPVAACPPGPVAAGDVFATPHLCVAFWHSLTESNLALPQIQRVGLASAVRVGFNVELYTYQHLEGAPEGVVVRDARDCMPEGEFLDCIARGVRVQHFSDLVRARAVSRSKGGWVCDCDSVWLRRPPALSITSPSNLGHFFASMHAAAQMRGHNKAETHKHWQLHYLRTPGDKLYLATPCAFPHGSPALHEWLSALDSIVAKKRQLSVAYDAPLSSLRSIIRGHGLEGSIVDAGVCSMVSRLHRGKAILANKVHLFDLSGLEGEALCCNNYWGSSKDGAAQDVKPEDGSAWSLVLKKAFPPKRRLAGKHVDHAGDFVVQRLENDEGGGGSCGGVAPGAPLAEGEGGVARGGVSPGVDSSEFPAGSPVLLEDPVAACPPASVAACPPRAVEAWPPASGGFASSSKRQRAELSTYTWPYALNI